MLCCLKKLVYLAIFIAIGTYAVNYWLGRKSYIFKETDVTKIGKKYVEYKGSVKQMVEAIRKDFKALYPDNILPKDDVEMFFFGMGGYKGAMFVYHASLTEYLVVFGTPMESSGYFVRQWVNETEVVLKGEGSLWKDGTTTVANFKPGSVLHHEVAMGGVVKYSADFWILGYGRGFVPANLPYYFATILFHSHDYSTCFRLMTFYAKCIFYNTVSYLT